MYLLAKSNFVFIYGQTLSLKKKNQGVCYGRTQILISDRYSLQLYSNTSFQTITRRLHTQTDQWRRISDAQKGGKIGECTYHLQPQLG